MEGELRDIEGPAGFVVVDKIKLEQFWNQLVQNYPHLGCEIMIGARVKYLIMLETRVAEATNFNSAAFKLGLRDKFAGWDERQVVAPSALGLQRPVFALALDKDPQSRLPRPLP